MGFALDLATRYARSRKRAFISVGTAFAAIGVLLGVAALTTVVSVTGGFFREFQDKVLGVNAHVLVLKYSSDFREYREIMKKVESVPGVMGVAPFVINPMMVTHGSHTATGVLLKGVDDQRLSRVLDLPRHIIEGKIEDLRIGAGPPPRRRDDPLGFTDPGLPEEANVAVVRGTLPQTQSPEPSPSRATESTEAELEEKTSAPLAVDAPVGNIQPDGGYQSQLPDEDVLPDDVVTDPCQSPEAIRQLPGIVVGKTLKDNLKLALGDCVQVTSPTIGFSYSGGVMRAPVAKQFRVVAVFDAGFDQYDSKLVYAHLHQAQAFYDTGDSVTGIEMRIKDIDQSKKIAQFIERKLDNGIYHTMDWEELNHGLFTALRIQQVLISLVLALIIVVAAFTVIATLIMVVLEKKKEIAILKAMGSTDGTLLRVFLYQGAFIGLAGTVLGLMLGWGACRALARYQFPLDPGVYFISKLPVRMQLSEFIMVGAFALLACLMATIWPAMYAARLRPAEAFRTQE